LFSTMAGRAMLIEAGRVCIPREAAWLAEYLHELSVFPNGKYDDQVDSTSQALELIPTPVMKGEAFLQIACEINRRAAEVPEPPAPRPTPPDPFPLVPKVWAVGCVEWQAEQDAFAAAAMAAAPPSPPAVAPIAATDGGSSSAEEPARRMPTFFVSTRLQDRI
jgi:hypothetical protein